MQNVHLKCSNDKSRCQVSVVGLKSLDVSPCNELLLFPMIIKNILLPENTASHISRHLEFIIKQGLRVAGFLGHWVARSQNETQFHLCITSHHIEETDAGLDRPVSEK